MLSLVIVFWLWLTRLYFSNTAHPSIVRVTQTTVVAEARIYPLPFSCAMALSSPELLEISSGKADGETLAMRPPSPWVMNVPWHAV